MGDGSMNKEIESKNKFFDSIVENKNQIIEASGFGDTGINIMKKSKTLKNLNCSSY